MKIALHLRHPDAQEQLEKFPNHLKVFYNQPLFSEDRIHSVDRIYIGDEFCVNRLPHLNELKHFCGFAGENDLNITLLTPVLTDKELENCLPLFEYLQKNHPCAEVTVNDLGVLLFLRKTYPMLCLSAGRLLNKGFKDPRLSAPDKFSLLSQEAHALLKDTTFDHAEFQNLMTELSVTRLERDIMPYGDCAVKENTRIKTSVYFPFGYITTGRVCWTASFRQRPKEKFMPVKHCTCPCDDITLELKNSKFSFQIIQNGNTVFYLYPESMLTLLIQHAEKENLRLVYQGFAIGR